MARQKYGGRAKGTPNKRTALVKERLDGLGLDPIEGMVELYREVRETDLRLAVMILKELCQYCYPKRKAVEIAVETENEPINEIALTWAEPEKLHAGK